MSCCEKTAVVRGDWYIDAVSGNDANLGASETDALKTHAELVRRLKGAHGPIVLSGDVVDNGGLPAFVAAVHILSDLPVTDPIELDALLAMSAIFLYQGKRTIVRTSALGFSAQSRASNTPCTISDSPFVWTPGMRVRIPLGPNANQTAWVAKNMGGGVALISTPSNPSYAPPTLQAAIGSASPGVFSNGDTYVVEEFPKVFLSHISVFASYATGTFGVLAFQDLDFQGINQPGGNPGNALAPQGNALVNFIACRFSARAFTTPLGTSATFINCCFAGSAHFNAGPTLDSGLALVAATGGARFFAGGALDGDFMVCGGPIKLRGSGLDVGTACVFDSPGDAVIVGEGPFGNPLTDLSVRDMIHGEHALWGSGNSGVGVRIGVGSSASYQTNVPTLTGTAGDFLTGDAATARAWDDPGNAYTALRACTWANVGATIAAGGFGGSCHNVQADAHLLGGVA